MRYPSPPPPRACDQCLPHYPHIYSSSRALAAAPATPPAAATAVLLAARSRSWWCTSTPCSLATW